MDALFQIGVAITSESTVEQVLQSILDECRRVLPVDTLYVALYDEESDSYEIPIFYDVGQYRSIERRECKAVRSLTCEVIAQRSALYIPDTHDLGAMSSHIAVYVAQAPTRTYLGVPMIFRERVIGVLSIQSLQVDAYDPSVLQLLQTVAMQAAVAVENARLYEAAQREIAERKQVEEELRVMATKYAALFNTAPVGISITDNAGRIVESNREAEHMLGITQEEQLERTYDGPEWQIVRPDGTPMPANEYASVRAFQEQRRVDNIEMGIVHSDGSISWISVNAVPIPLDGYGVAIAYTDITERKHAEDALRHSEQRYRMLADNVHDAVWARDLEGNLIYVSPSIARLWGYSRDELARRSPEGAAFSP
ncbi:MAG: PAS domain S-box protein, partial [Caldilineaceae bacterium]|nr:PAS domain S-box protein [Caldilineaceae bacterium]